MVVALGLTILQPLLWRFIGDAAVRFHQDRSQVHHVAQVEERLAAIRQEQQDLQAQLPQLAAIVPEDIATLSRLERLEAVAGTVGVTVEVRGIVEEVADESREGTPAPPGGVVVFPLAVTVFASGPPTALLDYIDAVEHMEELVHVRSLRLSPAQGGTAAGGFDLTAEIVFYLQRQADGIAN